MRCTGVSTVYTPSLALSFFTQKKSYPPSCTNRTLRRAMAAATTVDGYLLLSQSAEGSQQLPLCLLHPHPCVTRTRTTARGARPRRRAWIRGRRGASRREEETREECAEVRRQAVLACCNFWAYRLKFYMGHWLINHWIANFCLSQGRHSPRWPTCSTSEPEYPIMPQGPGSDSVPYLVSGTVDSSIDPNLTVTVH
jgi:hypothetical protein